MLASPMPDVFRALWNPRPASVPNVRHTRGRRCLDLTDFRHSRQCCAHQHRLTERYRNCVHRLVQGGHMPGIATIHQFLHDAHVPYSVLPHWPAYTAQQEAAATQEAEEDWAKVVVCFIDGEPVEVVVPASSYVNLER